MVRKVFRCAVGTRVFGWAVIVGGLIAIVGLVTMLVRGLGSLPIIITLLVLAVFGMTYLWRFALYPKVVVEDRVWVINPMHTHILTADEITDVRPGPNGLQLTHPDGVVEAWAVQKSTGAIKQGRATRADQIAADLLDALRGDSPAPGPAPAAVEASDAADDVEQDELDPTLHPDGMAEEPEAAEQPESASSPTELGDPDDPAAVGADLGDSPTTALAEDDPDDDTDEDLIIRRAHPDDLDTLVELEEEINTQALAHVFTAGEPFPAGSVTDRWSQSLGDRSYKVRVAEIDGEPVGYLCYDAQQLHQVGLLSRHSGRGHGRSLVEYAIDDMAARGTTAARLQVLEDNVDARDFYRHLGWTETGDRRPCPYPPHPTELTMALELNGEPG